MISHQAKGKKKKPNQPQVKTHLPPTATACGSQGWEEGRLFRSGLASPHGTEQLGASPSGLSMGHVMPSPALQHRHGTGAKGSRGQTNVPPVLSTEVWSPCHCLHTTEGIMAVPPPKPRQSSSYHKQTQQSVPSAQRTEAVGKDIRASLF